MVPLPPSIPPVLGSDSPSNVVSSTTESPPKLPETKAYSAPSTQPYPPLSQSYTQGPSFQLSQNSQVNVPNVYPPNQAPSNAAPPQHQHSGMMQPPQIPPPSSQGTPSPTPSTGFPPYPQQQPYTSQAMPPRPYTYPPQPYPQYTPHPYYHQAPYQQYPPPPPRVAYPQQIGTVNQDTNQPPLENIYNAPSISGPSETSNDENKQLIDEVKSTEPNTAHEKPVEPEETVPQPSSAKLDEVSQ
eukprot:XP_003246898.1 PREDICTED: leucine-rich repeat extensin-like protein 5 [Acyrthosiphon pisum]